MEESLKTLTELIVENWTLIRFWIFIQIGSRLTGMVEPILKIIITLYYVIFKRKSM